MELVLGKKFKLEVWEVIVQKMSLNEVAKFTVHKTVSLPFPFQSFPLYHASPYHIPIGNGSELEKWKPTQLDQSQHFQRHEETLSCFYFNFLYFVANRQLLRLGMADKK